uniref:Uncharacterized protein n=1 Tax=Glossina palpalis gambiensis TaxID=67801 RepID=A0A1B0BL40_9MUSC
MISMPVQETYRNGSKMSKLAEKDSTQIFIYQSVSSHDGDAKHLIHNRYCRPILASINSYSDAAIRTTEKAVVKLIALILVQSPFYFHPRSANGKSQLDMASPSSIVSGTLRPFVSGKKNVSTKPIQAIAAYTIGGITGEYKAKSLVINGAIIEPKRPKHEHKPIPVVRTKVGNISPAYIYVFGKVIDAPKRPTMAKTTTIVGFKVVTQAITKNPQALIAFDITIVTRRPKYFVIKTHKIVPGTPNMPLMNTFKNILPLNVDIN